MEQALNMKNNSQFTKWRVVMKHKALLISIVLFAIFGFSSCGMMAKMMGMGDMMGAMNNMDKVMAMEPSQMKSHAEGIEAAAWARGQVLFNDETTGNGKMGVSCNSCHPGGGTTGGEAQVPMRKFKMPIPSLVGAAGTFPKYKIPNDEVITLAHMNNNCIRMFMGGDGLELKSTDAWSLEKYVASLSNGETVTIGGQMSSGN